MRFLAVIAAVLAPAAASVPGGHGSAGRSRPVARQLVSAGYPYARECPEAGEADAVDRWKMITCNCTSYVAWALARNGYRTAWFVVGGMNARNWPRVARESNFHVGGRPRPGAVAVWPRWGRYGHVAFVTAVRPDGTFDVAEYNTPGRLKYGFDRRTHLSPRRVRFVYVPRRRG